MSLRRLRQQPIRNWLLIGILLLPLLLYAIDGIDIFYTGGTPPDDPHQQARTVFAKGEDAGLPPFDAEALDVTTDFPSDSIGWTVVQDGENRLRGTTTGRTISFDVDSTTAGRSVITATATNLIEAGTDPDAVVTDQKSASKTVWIISADAVATIDGNTVPEPAEDDGIIIAESGADGSSMPAGVTPLALNYAPGASFASSGLEQGTVTLAASGSTARIRVWQVDEDDNASVLFTSADTPVSHDWYLDSVDEIGDIFIEGVTAGPAVELTLSYDQTELPSSPELEDSVSFIVANDPIDIDIDSDNSNRPFELPDADVTEDDAEEDLPGKLVLVNSGDADADEIPDKYENFSIDDVASTDPNARPFTPVRLSFNQADVEYDMVNVTFTYSADDPADVERTETDIEGLYEYSQPTGAWRLWKMDGNEVRNPASVADGGDFIPSGEGVSLEDLGITSQDPVTLYLECVASTAEGQNEILVETADTQDRVMASGIRLQNQFVDVNSGEIVDFNPLTVVGLHFEDQASEDDWWADQYRDAWVEWIDYDGSISDIHEPHAILLDPGVEHLERLRPKSGEDGYEFGVDGEIRILGGLVPAVETDGADTWNRERIVLYGLHFPLFESVLEEGDQVTAGLRVHRQDVEIQLGNGVGTGNGIGSSPPFGSASLLGRNAEVEIDADVVPQGLGVSVEDQTDAPNSTPDAVLASGIDTSNLSSGRFSVPCTNPGTAITRVFAQVGTAQIPLYRIPIEVDPIMVTVPDPNAIGVYLENVERLRGANDSEDVELLPLPVPDASGENSNYGIRHFPSFDFTDKMRKAWAAHESAMIQAAQLASPDVRWAEELEYQYAADIENSNELPLEVVVRVLGKHGIVPGSEPEGDFNVVWQTLREYGRPLKIIRRYTEISEADPNMVARKRLAIHKARTALDMAVLQKIHCYFSLTKDHAMIEQDSFHQIEFAGGPLDVSETGLFESWLNLQSNTEVFIQGIFGTTQFPLGHPYSEEIINQTSAEAAHLSTSIIDAFREDQRDIPFRDRPLVLDAPGTPYNNRPVQIILDSNGEHKARLGPLVRTQILGYWQDQFPGRSIRLTSPTTLITPGAYHLRKEGSEQNVWQFEVTITRFGFSTSRTIPIKIRGSEDVYPFGAGTVLKERLEHYHLFLGMLEELPTQAAWQRFSTEQPIAYGLLMFGDFYVGLKNVLDLMSREDAVTGERLTPGDIVMKSSMVALELVGADLITDVGGPVVFRWGGTLIKGVKRNARRLIPNGGAVRNTLNTLASLSILDDATEAASRQFNISRGAAGLVEGGTTAFREGLRKFEWDEFFSFLARIRNAGVVVEKAFLPMRAYTRGAIMRGGVGRQVSPGKWLQGATRLARRAKDGVSETIQAGRNGIKDAVETVRTRMNRAALYRQLLRDGLDPQEALALVDDASAKLCFPAGTPVRMADGSMQAIETVAVGDQVATRSYADAKAPMVAGKVRRLYKRPADVLIQLEYLLASGERGSLQATPNHPFWVRGRGWVDAENLQLADQLAALNGDVIVSGISKRELAVPVPVYNFSVGNHHSYFVGGSALWAHNLCAEGKRIARDLLASGGDLTVGRKTVSPGSLEYVKAAITLARQMKDEQDELFRFSQRAPRGSGTKLRTALFDVLKDANGTTRMVFDTLARGFQAHHISPSQLVQRGSAGADVLGAGFATPGGNWFPGLGFLQNSKANGILLPENLGAEIPDAIGLLSGRTAHKGSHPGYNQAWEERIEDLRDQVIDMLDEGADTFDVVSFARDRVSDLMEKAKLAQEAGTPPLNRRGGGTNTEAIIEAWLRVLQ